MNTEYKLLPELFLRAPFYSFAGYDLERLSEVLGHQAFRNAIWLASPGFYRILEGKGFDFETLSEKEKHTLYKYYNRMCFRPTPFGSFASITLLEWGDGGTVKLAGDETAKLHLLPDMQLLAQLRNLQNKAEGPFIKNPTLYRVGNEYRYVKSIIDKKGHYRFSLDVFPAEEFYTFLFSFLGNKPSTSAALTSWMAGHSDSTAAEVLTFLEFLLEAQILYHQSTGAVIDSFKIDRVPGLPGLSEFWMQHRHRPFLQSGNLASAAAALETLLPNVKLTNDKACFYAALERAKENGGLGSRDKKELGAAVHMLSQFAMPVSSDILRKFIAAFKERFDLEKVPLLTALDPDAGIPYGNFGVASPARGFEEIRFPEKPAGDTQASWSAAHHLLFRLWGEARCREKFAPLIIQPQDLPALEGSTAIGALPSTLAVMFRKTESHLLIEHAGGATATALIGRFSAFSDTVGELCCKLVQLESTAHPDIIFSDIGQLSNTHTDNINLRAQVYGKEIPINVYSALSDTAQIQLDDLLLSVRQGELIIESASLEKRVIPRMSTAYNYQHNELAIFRLLCDLQYQGLRTNFNFNMENYFPGQAFYPRVVYENVVVSLAKWRLEEQELKVLFDDSKDELLTVIRLLRDRHGISQRISTGNFDQQLVFDLGDRHEAQFFIDFIRGAKVVTITEYLLPGRTVKTGNKPLAGQFIAFLSRDEKIYNGLIQNGRPGKAIKKRNFLMGGDWLYVKIYCTPESSAIILANIIGPVIHKNSTHISNWFFIRYFDDGYHLRLRIRTAAEKIGLMLTDLKKQMEATGNEHLVKNYVGDIYRREMERYGADMIEAVEDFFCAGSGLVSQFVMLKENDPGVWEEFDLALYTTFQLLNCFFGGAAAAFDFSLQMSVRYLKEFSGGRELKTDLDMKYRSLKPRVMEVLEEQGLPAELLKPFETMTGKVATIINLAVSRTVTERAALYADLVHMQLNRTFSAKQRQQELIVYYVLQKYLATVIARKNKTNHA